MLDYAGILDEPDSAMPTFGTYPERWLRDYARLECKPSTARGYEGVLRQYLHPRFGSRRLDQIEWKDLRIMISELVEQGWRAAPCGTRSA